ncbi:hypothetical protein FDP41_012665 [Naegleria fowleri]|uniref:Dynein light chain n=1 Tax=Naegleria fowleri TaxID=5763 RepID=A0A6A5BUJ0_NAEFO|nr:uncharacterized protein FDP41_012665 [Naegleria fowleri]KAF0980877.1 hypothetical protein FDP41_012665 [Naegleria fowleri]CAG4710743.1 unnamed protein product [Naegleria fowleri]
MSDVDPSNTTLSELALFQLRPNFRHKFKSSEVKEIIKEVVTNRLKGKDYQMEQVQQWIKDICNEIRDKCMELKYERYKFIVNVMIGEQRGEGVKMGCRCFWDEDCDSYATHTFMNHSLFCSVTAFGIYNY